MISRLTVWTPVFCAASGGWVLRESVDAVASSRLGLASLLVLLGLLNMGLAVLNIVIQRRLRDACMRRAAANLLQALDQCRAAPITGADESMENTAGARIVKRRIVSALADIADARGAA